MSENYGFQGAIPPGVSVSDNITKALQYKATHTPQETLTWFYEHVRNNKDNHLSQNESMDYKQIDPSYSGFGNFNYGAVGYALGIPDIVLESILQKAQPCSTKNSIGLLKNLFLKFFRIKYLLVVFLLYALLIFIAMLIEVHSIDHASSLKIRKSMNEENCASSGASANPLKIWEFYFNTEYWLAEYKGNIKILSTEKCLRKIVSLLQESNSSNISAVFIDNEDKTFLVLKRKTFFKNHTKE